jgi:hypothetical protein
MTTDTVTSVPPPQAPPQAPVPVPAHSATPPIPPVPNTSLRGEIVHLHIVKLIHPTPGGPPVEVLDVVEGPAVPFIETVRAYPNQVLPAGISPAEREVAVRQ